MTTSQVAVVDAGLTVFLLLDTPFSEMASRVWQQFQEKRTELFAPFLWEYEVTSVIRKYQYDKLIDLDEADQALNTAFKLSIKLHSVNPSLWRPAFRWARVLNQRVAYDGFYLALAENLNAPFWTSDQRLVNSARQAGIEWIHWMGDFS